jgi:PIN domain nuclease of toxin-antitoxin system
MNCLVDTHVMLWLLEDSLRLGPRTREWIHTQTRVFVSTASLWEIAIKRDLGKLSAPEDLPELIEQSGLEWLPIGPQDAWATTQVAGLPHRDPFDRLLVTQALRNGLTLATADRALLDAPLEPAVSRHDATT